MMTLKQLGKGRLDQPEIKKPEEGEVRVNQRALVRKILSRYSYDFAVFRELLQNAEDARSDNVIIHFEKDQMPSGIAKCIVENSGDAFTPKDWDRLTEIANGNPDSGKVGAFGVGFYSIFSLTDNPVVFSGGRKMEFRWEGGVGPLRYCLSEHHTPPKGAKIEMLLKNAEIPERDDLFRFLATSITFMKFLKNVEVILNKVSIGRISKSKENVEESNKPPIKMEPVGPSVMRFLEPLKLQRRQFTIEYFPHAKKPNVSSKLGLSIFSIEAGIEMDDKLKGELYQCTFKDRAPRVKYSMIYTGKEDYDKSSADKEHGMIFQELRADLNDALRSKIFIGHSTRQTTGIGGHMESDFIPTVERESIDLVDKNVAIWNDSLLYLGGFLSRVVYESELSDIQNAWIKLNGSDASETPNFKPLRERFIHVLNFFTFRPSTPSPKVAEKLCASFYTCSTSPLRLLSSVGVREVSKIRLHDQLCEQFLKDVPMLSSDFSNLAAEFVKARPSRQGIQRLKLSDVEGDLKEHSLSLSNGELLAFLEWVLREGIGGAGTLLRMARFQDVQGEEVPLSSIQYFIHPGRDGAYIPLDGPLPRSVLPHQITHSLTPAKLERFQWREFTIVDWLLHVSSQAVRSDLEGTHDFTKSPDWAERVLHCVSSAWSSGGDIIKRAAADVFKTEKCIPTTHGLHIPDQSCLPNPNITRFDELDFPMVQLPSGRQISEEMVELLITLGVKKHPPVRLVLKQEKWEISELIKYLVRMFTSFSDSDIEELKSSSIFAKKGNRKGDSDTSFRANQLYPPTKIFQKLGLPLIDWGESSEWQDASCEEVKLLYSLGLRRFPPLKDIIKLCSQDTSAGEFAFEYLCNDLQKKYSDRTVFEDFRNIAFVPMESKDGVGRGKLGEVFLNKQWKEFGFPTVLPRYENSAVEGLGVQHHPPPSLILRQLERFAKDPSSSEDTARRLFSILSDHVSRFQTNELHYIAGLTIVPVITREGKKTMLTPVECYLGHNVGHDLYPKLFHFVDFGIGDKFLRACNAKNTPAKEDVAQKLINNPKVFYDLAGGHRQFLEVLHHLASENPSISNEIVEKMKSQPVLLGITKEPKEDYVLKKPREIAIVDDERTFQFFADSIIAAPRNMPRELEGFYMLLGCQPLTTAIRDQLNPFGEIEDPRTCEKYRQLILERLPIFLHNYPHLKPGTRESRFYGVDAITVIVKLWEKLSVSKTLSVANNATTNEQLVSATAIYKGKTLQLWLTSPSVEQDIVHDLAVSLCRVFLGTESPPDVEFLTNCLSEKLDVLKRRGHEIDQQCLDNWRLPRPANSSSIISPSIPSPSLPVNDSMDEPSITDTDHDHATRGTTKQTCLPGGSTKGVLRKVREIPSSNTPAAVLRQSSDRVMHTKDIESTIKIAIQGCKSRQQMPHIPHTDPNTNKFLNGYCGVSAPVDDLKLFRRVRGVDVHVARDFPDVNTNSACIPELLSHFLDILERVAAVYDLSTNSYCIFATAGCIAFNHQGTIYLNLQYFEKWHYKDVSDGRRRRAFTLWFLTFAHEIAHNLVPGHDSEHEFWFLAICEKYMDEFSGLLGSASA